MDGRYNSGGPWEAAFGYSRAVRIDNIIAVSGTTAAEPDGTYVAPDAAGQARRIFEIVGGALSALGSSLQDVIRVRIFLRDIADLTAVGAVFREVFAGVAPAATGLQVSSLIAEEALVEIEVDAVVRR